MVALSLHLYSHWKFRDISGIAWVRFLLEVLDQFQRTSIFLLQLINHITLENASVWVLKAYGERK